MREGSPYQSNGLNLLRSPRLVNGNGNVLAAISFLHGLTVEELHQEELDYYDPNYDVLVTLRAVKPEFGRRTSAGSGSESSSGD